MSAVHMEDLESALYYSLWMEIGAKSSLSDQEIEALKNYVELLAKVSTVYVIVFLLENCDNS